jgi:pSer/pThr/pTyr-binding forkhead associated (FHA) protein
VPFLVWETPRGRVVRELDRSLLVIGRDPVADVHLDEPTVSRRHALIEVGARVRLTDLGSSTGTKINGAVLRRDLASTLEAGDLLHVGAVALAFHERLPAGHAPPPQQPAAPAPRPRARPAAVERSPPGRHRATLRHPQPA